MSLGADGVSRGIVDEQSFLHGTSSSAQLCASPRTTTMATDTSAAPHDRGGTK